jgi:hypothetical protein
MKLPRSVKGQSLDSEVGIEMTTAVMDYIGCVWADTGISTGEEVSNEDAPVGRVILDWTRTRGWACTTIVMKYAVGLGKHSGQDGCPGRPSHQTWIGEVEGQGDGTMAVVMDYVGCARTVKDTPVDGS